MMVVAGEALIDLVLAADGSLTPKLGGGPFNVARTIARLGGDVSFLGAVSTDRFGQQFARQLELDGVSPAATVRTDAPTTLAVAEIDDHGSATYRFYLDGTSAPSLDAVPAAARACEALHVGTLGLVLEPMATTLVDLVDSLPDDVLVMTDPNCRARVIPDRDAYLARLAHVHRRAQVVKISTDDAEFMAPGRSALDLAADLVADGIRAVLVTGGSEAAWVVSPQGATSVPTVPIRVADTIGAGDSFGGAFLAWWRAAGLGIAELAQHDALVAATAAAQQVAAITCSRVGADPPHRADLPAEWGHWQG
jgi:fructokinase